MLTNMHFILTYLSCRVSCLPFYRNRKSPEPRQSNPSSDRVRRHGKEPGTGGCTTAWRADKVGCILDSDHPNKDPVEKNEQTHLIIIHTNSFTFKNNFQTKIQTKIKKA